LLKIAMIAPLTALNKMAYKNLGVISQPYKLNIISTQRGKNLLALRFKPHNLLRNIELK